MTHGLPAPSAAGPGATSRAAASIIMIVISLQQAREVVCTVLVCVCVPDAHTRSGRHANSLALAKQLCTDLCSRLTLKIIYGTRRTNKTVEKIAQTFSLIWRRGGRGLRV